MSEKEWVCYIIQNNNCTYVGVSPDPVRRLRQHNGEIKGGAKYTLSKGAGWEHICLIKGFHNKIQSMQFEWAVKHVAPRDAGGRNNRIKKLYNVVNKSQWTSKAPPSEEVPLNIEWYIDDSTINEYEIPSFISQSFLN